MAIVVSVKSKQTLQQQQQRKHWECKCEEDWDVVCCKGGGFVVALCMAVCADEGPDLLCLLFFLFSLVGFVWIWENPLCLHQRVVEWLWCMPVSPPTIINSNEDVLTDSCFLLSVLIPWVLTEKHAYYSYFIHTFSTTFIFSPNPRLHNKSSPIPWLLPSLFTHPLSCVVAKVQVSIGIYLISIFMFKVRFIELPGQSQRAVGSRKHHAFD